MKTGIIVMDKLIEQLEKYFLDVLGIRVSLPSWEKKRDLPQYLRNSYDYFSMRILGAEYVVMVDLKKGERTPANIRKDWEQIRSRYNLEGVYVAKAIMSYNRKRLVEQRMPFVVPGNQMYLPTLGIDLREHFNQLRKKKEILSPSTQALILYVIYQKVTGVIKPAEIAKSLGYAAMTMTRAFDELEEAGIGEYSVSGKERHLHFLELGKSFWESVLPLLATPVKKRLYVEADAKIRKSNRAGLTALAAYTEIAEPEVPIFAYSNDEWKALQLQQKKIHELPYPEAKSVAIELWKYSPSILAQEGKVDRLSLYLSLKESGDERVQSALDELLRGIQW